MDLFGELSALVSTLEARSIPYALCGGLALAVHGAARATQDIDILARREDEETLRQVAKDRGFVFASLPMELAPGNVTVNRFTKVIGDVPLMLDVLWADAALSSIWESRQAVPFDGGTLQVVSREGLISMKLAAGRPQDIADVQRLEELGRG